MKTYNFEAERHFFDKVQSFAISPIRWRMIHLDMNASHGDADQKSKQSRVLATIIREALKEHDLYVYLLYDGDIVVLLQGAVTPVFQALAARVDGIVPDINQIHEGCLHHNNGVFHYYDLSIAFSKAAILADSKLAAFEQIVAKESANAAVRMPHIPPATIEWDNNLFTNAAKQRQARNSMQVLIIEDDSFTARLVGNVMRSEAEIIDAASGHLGITAYTMCAPDMLFLDIELPDSNGHALLKQIVANDPDAFVVMLSGNSQKENVIAALEDGARGFVSKPFARERIVHYMKLAEKTKSQRIQMGNFA